MAKILVLDDNKDLHEALDLLFSLSSDLLTHAYSHEDAVRCLADASETFDRFYLDINLGACHSGWDTACFLVEKYPRERWPKEVVVHSCDSIEGEDLAHFLRMSGVSAVHRMFGED